jgi:hypothetical protein
LSLFAPGVQFVADQALLSYFKGPSQPFGVTGEFYRAVLLVKSEEHARQVLAELGVTSAAEDIGRAFIEEIAGVSVWGDIEEKKTGSWQMVLEVHDPDSPYRATCTAFMRACVVNRALVAYLGKHAA